MGTCFYFFPFYEPLAWQGATQACSQCHKHAKMVEKAQSNHLCGRNPTTFNRERNSSSKHIPQEKKKVRFPAPSVLSISLTDVLPSHWSSLEGPSSAKGWNYGMQDPRISWKRPTRIKESSPWPISRTPALIRTVVQLLPPSNTGTPWPGLCKQHLENGSWQAERDCIHFWRYFNLIRSLKSHPCMFCDSTLVCQLVKAHRRN